MKQSEWDSYWDKKINEHFNVKPAERIVLREFVEEVFNEKYGIDESSLSVGELIKSPDRIKAFLEKIKSGSLFTLNKPNKLGRLEIDPKDRNIPKSEKGKVLIDPKSEETKNTVDRMTDYLSFAGGTEKDKQRIIKKYKKELVGEWEILDILKVKPPLKLGTDYFAADDKGMADESSQVDVSLSALAKTDEFGGRGSAGPAGADWEYLIAWANNNEDPSAFEEDPDKYNNLANAEGGFYANQARAIAETIKKKYPKLADETFSMLGKSPAVASDLWNKSFADIDQKVKGATLTSKTDVAGGSTYKMSFKKAGGAQLMSAGRGEALATINAVSSFYKFSGDKTAEKIQKIQEDIQKRFNAKLTDPDNPKKKLTITNIEKEMKGLTDEEKIDLANKAAKGEPNLIGQVVNDDKMHKEVSADLQSILNETVTRVTDAAAADLQGEKFGTLLCLEAMTGNIKFKSKPHRANYLFCFDPTSAKVKLKKITLKEAAQVASTAKFYVSYKTSGNPYSSLKIGHATKLEEAVENMGVFGFTNEYSKILLKEEMKVLSESVEKDKDLLSEFQWFMQNDGAKILQENDVWNFSKNLFDKGKEALGDATAALVSKGKDAIERAKLLWNKLKAIASKAWDAVVSAVTKAFNFAMESAKKIATAAGAVAGFKAIGLELDAGGDSDGMESNPDIADLFLS